MRWIALLLCWTLLSSCQTWQVVDHRRPATVESAQLTGLAIRITDETERSTWRVRWVDYPNLGVVPLHANRDRREVIRSEGSARPSSQEKLAPEIVTLDLRNVDLLELRSTDVGKGILVVGGGLVLAVALSVGLILLLFSGSDGVAVPLFAS